MDASARASPASPDDGNAEIDVGADSDRENQDHFSPPPRPWWIADTQNFAAMNISIDGLPRLPESGMDVESDEEDHEYEQNNTSSEITPPLSADSNTETDSINVAPDPTTTTNEEENTYQDLVNKLRKSIADLGKQKYTLQRHSGIL